MSTIWTPKIKKGSTFRVPVTIRDRVSGSPSFFVDTVFTITPNVGIPFTLTPANGKLTINSFNWRSAWWKDTAYAIGDVVSYKGYLWKAIQISTNKPPFKSPDSSTYWRFFSSVEFLISAVETSGYTWTAATYKWTVVRSNGDIEDPYLEGSVEI